MHAGGGSEPVPFMPHRLDDLVDLFLGQSSGGFPADSGRHRSLVGVDFPVGGQVQFPVEHLPVKLRARKTLPAALAENAKHHFGCLHSAYLMVFHRSSPVPLRPVVRLSRSPDWAGRYSADYYRHSVAVGLAPPLPVTFLRFVPIPVDLISRYGWCS